MKATILKSVVLVTLFFAAVINFQASAQDNFVTNEEVVNDLVVSKTIYKNDGMLYRHMKYDYGYDEQNRMVSKEAFKWDEKNKNWMQYYKVTYSYSDNEIVMDYAKWNSRKKVYDQEKERNIYELNDANQPVAYINFGWDKKNNDWKLIDMQTYTYNDFLLAENNKI